MSKTKRNYPTYYYKYKGVFYTGRDELPKYTRWIKSFRIEKCERLERVFYDKYLPDRNQHISYFKVELVPYYVTIRDGWREYETEVVAALVYCYNEKSTEGWKHNNRQWGSEGVGKDNKRIREKQFRARNRQALHKCLKGFEDETVFPISKPTDRWDWW